MWLEIISFLAFAAVLLGGAYSLQCYLTEESVDGWREEE